LAEGERRAAANNAIVDYERERSISKTMVAKIQTALEAQGIKFTNGKRPGR